MGYKIDNIYVKKFSYFNLYIIKGEDGDILIDTGFICLRKKLKRWLDKFNIKLIVLTHAHADHIWNVQYIKKLYNCKVMMGIDDIENIGNNIVKSKASKKKYVVWTKLMNWGMKKFVPQKFDVDVSLTDNYTIDKYGIKLKVVSLAGHTKGSVGLLYKDYMFVGDALVSRGRFPEIAYQNQDYNKALAAYEKIIELKPRLLFLGHDRKVSYEKLNKNLYK